MQERLPSNFLDMYMDVLYPENAGAIFWICTGTRIVPDNPFAFPDLYARDGVMSESQEHDSDHGGHVLYPENAGRLQGWRRY